LLLEEQLKTCQKITCREINRRMKKEAAEEENRTKLLKGRGEGK